MVAVIYGYCGWRLLMPLRLHGTVAALAWILLIAMTAITRKVVILDAGATDPMMLFGIGFVIIALSVGYYLVHRSKTGSQTD